MKPTALAIVALFLSPLVQAAGTIDYADPSPGGIGYEWTVTLGSNDTTNTGANVNSHVGAWSWEDQSLTPSLGEATVGWTHTSQWAAVTLDEAAYFTFQIAASSLIPFSGTGNVGGFRPSDQFFPSFSLYSGWDNDEMPEVVASILGVAASAGETHTYNNRGGIAWAEDLTFLGLKDNTTGNFAEATWLLPAGKYTVVLGSNAPSTANPPRQGFLATFSTTPVPEPSAALLALCAASGFTLRHRR